MSAAAVDMDQVETLVRTEDSVGPRRQCILILGMHRSGTSAVAGALSALGVALPKKTLMGPHPCNQRGLFESFALACAHDELLASANSHWHDWRHIESTWLGSPAARKHWDRIKKVIVDEFD